MENAHVFSIFMSDNHWRLMNSSECVYCVCVRGPFVFFALYAHCIYRFKWPLEKRSFVCNAATAAVAATTREYRWTLCNVFVYKGETEIHTMCGFCAILSIHSVSFSRSVWMFIVTLQTVKQKPSKLPRRRLRQGEKKHEREREILSSATSTNAISHNRIMVAATATTTWMDWCVCVCARFLCTLEC